MPTGAFCGVGPLLFRRRVFASQGKSKSNKKGNRSSKNVRSVNSSKVESSLGVAGNFVTMTELRKKISSLRGALDFSPCAGSASVVELLLLTLNNLFERYPKIKPVSEFKGASLHKALKILCDALVSLGNLWTTEKWMVRCEYDSSMVLGNAELEKTAIEMLDDILKVARETLLDDMEDDEDMSPARAMSESYCENRMSYSGSPGTPTSVLPWRSFSVREKSSYSPLHLPLKVGGLSPIDVKRLSFYMLPHSVVPQDHKHTMKSGDEMEMKCESPTGSVGKKDDKFHSQDEATPIALENQEVDVCSSPSPSNKDEKLLHNQDRLLSVLLPVTPPSSPSFTPRNSVATNSSSLPSFSQRNCSPPPPPPPPPPPAITASKGNGTSPPPTPSPPGAAQPPSPPGVDPLPPPPPFGVVNGVVPPPPPAITGSTNGNGGAAPPPPPPFMGASKGNGGDALPPPPPGAPLSLRPNRLATKLKRSSQMGALYRVLKGKVEGSSLDRKSSEKKGKIGGGATAGGKGMADALAEMTKRSAYYQQIEEDCRVYGETVKEVKKAISAFQTSDMNELIKFHKYVESHLEKLTDETQVLARCEDFPSKKLEALRMAAALYSKLDSIVTTLENWQIVSPVGQLLDKTEAYFNKIKVEMDALERTKDEESTRFQAQKITFDFGILVRIKELVVDVSSHCMELALKEKREPSSEEGEKGDGKKKGSAKMLWRAFQFAFRVYTFAGGHDERADKLTRELAQAIETVN